MSEEFQGLGKLDPMRMKGLQQRAYVKDMDFQVHVPTTAEPHSLDDTHSFKNVLTGYLDDVNTIQHDADAQIQRLVAGQTEDIHEVTMAMDEAEASFELMMEIRNKLVDAYQDLMRMQ